MSEKDQNKNADEVVPNEEFENLSPLQATGRPVNDSATEYAETALASRGEAPEEKLEDRIKTLSPGAMVAKRFFRSKLSVVGLVTLILLFAFSFF